MIDDIKNEELKRWIHEVVELCEPAKVHVCNGSETEYQSIAAEMVKSGTFIPLDEHKRPNSFLARSNPDDVARVEERTFICTTTEEEAGPTNHWKEPAAMESEMRRLFKGCMKGRTLYVIPYSMGPLGSEIAHIGVELSDSPYVVCNMRIMTRMGQAVLDLLGEQGTFVKCLHSVGVPLGVGEEDVAWPCNPEKTAVVHFPEKQEIWSFGSGYGGNALLGKKCFALRIASHMAQQQGWLAEHMLIVGVTAPDGKKKYFAAAFPSACGKTNLAMLESSLSGWRVECIGDDIAWMKFGQDGQLYAINPEAGFFGVAPGTSSVSNPNALASCAKNAIFTNVALTPENDVWWEGMTEKVPPQLTSWLGKPWTPESTTVAAHPNSRFTAPAAQCPVIDPAWESPEGVPISAIIFGGRRGTTVPLVYESLDWEHGVFIGASVSSEMTAAAAGTVGKLRHDPFAMLPFCGYNMADYFQHWLDMGGTGRKLPKIYGVNWFRKSHDGNFLWPGFGENMRVLKWIYERCDGDHRLAQESPIGMLPTIGALDLAGLHVSEEMMEELFCVDNEEWLAEMEEMRTYLTQFGAHLPPKIVAQLERLEKRLHGTGV